MSKDLKFKQAIQQLASHFFAKKKVRNSEEEIKPKYMHLNFFLMTHVLGYIQGRNPEKKPLLFTKKILTSNNHHLSEMVKQAQSCCLKQDLHLMSYRQFFLRNEFTMRRVIEWKLSKYIKGEKQIRAFIEKMKESSPQSFKNHLITLLNKENQEISREELEQELKRQEDNWKLYQHHNDGGPTKISPV